MNQTHPTIEQLIDYLHGELPAPDDAAIHAHLANCTACAQARDAEIRLSELLREHARAEERELPPYFYPRLSATLASGRQRPTWRERFAVILRPAFAVPLAVVLLLAVYLGMTRWPSSTLAITTIDAAAYLDEHAALEATAPFAQGPVVPDTLTELAATNERQAHGTP